MLEGVPYVEIMEAAKGQDLIVMGTPILAREAYSAHAYRAPDTATAATLAASQ